MQNPAVVVLAGASDGREQAPLDLSWQRPILQENDADQLFLSFNNLRQLVLQSKQVRHYAIQRHKDVVSSLSLAAGCCRFPHQIASQYSLWWPYSRTR